MSFTTPIYIPLVEGLDLSKDAVLGTKELHAAENIDFSVQGEARGRPSRAAAASVVLRDPSSSTGGLLASQAFSATGLTPLGLMRHKDITGERPMLGTAGRLLAKDGATWRDWGHFACAKHDRLATFHVNLSGGRRKPVAQDFGPTGRGMPTGSTQWFRLLDSDGTPQHEVTAGLPTTVGGQSSGSSARCGTTTALVTVNTSNTRLYFVYRTNGGDTLTSVVIATDAASPSDDGDAPIICCDYDQTAFFVVYQTTVANQYKVLKVTTTGTVSATYTGSLVGIAGHWVANSAVADNKVVVALTNANGLTIKVLNATTMADNAVDSTHGVANCEGREVVVGVESATRAWWCYRQNDNLGGGTGTAGTYLGVVDPGTAASASAAHFYFSNSLADSLYTPLHQPIKFGGRMYFSMVRYTYPDVTEPGVGTWFTFDLSNIQLASSPPGPMQRPTLVARGKLDGCLMGTSTSTTAAQPEAATLLSDSSGWTFPSVDWQSFDLDQSLSNLSGQRAMTVLNRIQMSGPRAALVGDATLISGSVPHMVAGGECYEVGFPAGKPLCGVNPVVGGGAIGAAGSYTITVCWMYIDGAGQIHRSAPSNPQTQSVANATDYIEVYIDNPFITERPNGDIKLEVYCTEVNPTADSLSYLQAVVNVDYTQGSTKYNLGQGGSIETSSERLYTSQDEFSHMTPVADGGIATVGRRVWMASATTAYASLLLLPGKGPAWNDEGALQVDLPAGAGRILALEGLDDKLVIFCERGIYLTQDGGPDNTGQGPDIAFPIRLSDLGCAGPRSTCTTDRGVVFCSPLDNIDPQRGGPWLLDRSLSLTERRYLGSPAMNFFDASSVPEVAFSPERQQVYVSVPVADSAGNSGVVVIDFRASKWSTWSHTDSTQGDLRSIDVVEGCLWSLGTNPAGFTGEPGTDADGNYQMLIATGKVHANGTDGVGWSRVRSVSPLGQPMGSHDLVISAVQDDTITSQSATIAVTTPGASTTWPSTRHVPEWRLPNQKCSTISVLLTSSNGYARWKAIRLDVQPLPRRAPAGTRI